MLRSTARLIAGLYAFKLGAPEVTDDASKGHVVGQRWIDKSHTPAKEYVLVDNSIGAAVWADTTAASYIRLSLDGLAPPEGDVNFAQQQATGFRIENRTSDPISPALGEIWLRTDL